MAQSGDVIDGLHDQIRQRDEEMAEMGAHTARMQAQLLELLGQLDGRTGLSGWSDSEPPPPDPPF